MGWKIACILINERERGYLRRLPAHDQRAARELIEQLGLGLYLSLELTDFDYGMYPKEGRLVIGAYPGAAIVASQDLVFGTVTGENTSLLNGLLKVFPAAEILVLELHSVVNYFAYACYQQDKLLRAYAGSADDGILIESGEMQPEEQALFDRSMVRDGVRYFKFAGDNEEYTLDQVGEEIVFALATRILGEPLDEFSSEDLVVEEFEKESV